MGEAQSGEWGTGSIHVFSLKRELTSFQLRTFEELHLTPSSAAVWKGFLNIGSREKARLGVLSRDQMEIVWNRHLSCPVHFCRINK